MTAHTACAMVGLVTRSEAIDHLPAVYGRIVGFVDAGVSPDEIARQLDLDTESVGPLITVAMAKLDTVLSGATQS